MSSIRRWALWRRIQYVIASLLFFGLIGVLVYFNAFYVPPNCFDGELNGAETGLDCGGDCVQICIPDILPPSVVWAESFEITDDQYNLVAYIENPNQTAGTPNLSYTFEMYSGDELVAERSGVTILPPNSVYPIFEGRVRLEDNVEITDTRVSIDLGDYWLPSSVGRGQFRVNNINLLGVDEQPRLQAQIENTALNNAEDVEVVATIFNDAGRAVTASETYLENIPARSTQDITFTWPNPISKTVRSCSIPTDVSLVIDVSGSMNNDGDNPPQPITDALESASEFIMALQDNDLVSIVTFASEAEIISPLTGGHASATRAVLDLSIDESAESGFTNTVEALRVAGTELNSSRHNPNARRAMVLLTDGLPTAEGEVDITADTIAEAEALNEGGVELYAIGLGENVNTDFINQLASSDSNAYFAPTGDDLQAIYQEITSSLCEVGPTRIEVIAKTGANFAPLR